MRPLTLRGRARVDSLIFFSFPPRPPLTPSAEEERVAVHVAAYQGRPAAVVVTRSGRSDALRMRANYNLEEFVLYSQHPTRQHVNLHHYISNPVLRRWSKFVLGEVMRQRDATCLYHRLYPTTAGEGVGKPTYSVSSVIDELIPVRPREQPKCHLDVLQGNVPAERLRELGPPFALLFMTRKLLL